MPAHAARISRCVIAALLLAGGLAASAARASEGAWWQPPQRLTWYWQLQGSVSNKEPVAAYDIDGFENSAAEVAALHGEGKHVICYIDVGTAENFRPDYSEFPPSVLGNSNGWPGEIWIDIRQLSVIEPIMTARFQMCREKGFDAVEPDNIEAYSNDSGFPITAAEQLTYNEWIADEVHSLGMAVLQKNDGEQTAELESYFDGALSEQCNQYRRMRRLRALPAGRQAGPQRRVQAPTEEVLRGGHSGRVMGARFNLALNGRKLRTLLVARVRRSACPCASLALA